MSEPSFAVIAKSLSGYLALYTRTRFTHHDCCLFGREKPRCRQIGNTIVDSFVSGWIDTRNTTAVRSLSDYSAEDAVDTDRCNYFCQGQ